MTDDEVRSEARETYYLNSNNIEIHEDAPLNEDLPDGKPSGGCWVQAWVWVPTA